ncbi:beta-lactamase family protein [Brachybacterium huguangmaarense]|uniref:Beta-lactamase family protein n=1 Tax=Brachybacterium huguangmaarense TaxID=1652028 RepID=A0ABY6FY35_9MICO|nr:serine hydrolase domain-containing protein [Brachybacterium huguangmaarense]UYG15835.1 beta-lactamase family protein [Brachybacterium huguangmaarense]
MTSAAPSTVDDPVPGLEALADGLVAGARDGRAEGASAVVAAIARPDGPPHVVARGTTALFTADGELLPPEDPVAAPVTRDTLFDLASVTKVVTTLVAATLVDDGLLDPDAPVVEVLGAPVPDVRLTARHLLTHTAGLPATLPLWRVPGGREARRTAIRHAVPRSEPGRAHEYSCIGFLLLGMVLETLGGEELPALARRRVLDPAGARDATWHVAPPDVGRCAATEYEDDPPRGLVRGEVHDETAWSLSREPGSGAANAGLFATVDDLLALGRVLAGTAERLRLTAATRRLLSTDQLGDAVPTGAPWRQGLGLRVGQELPDGQVLPRVVGHTGFTGTSIAADPVGGTVAVLATNRVHPRRDRFTVVGARREIARLAIAGAGA